MWSGNSVWYPVNLIAATLLASLQAASPEDVAQFSLSGLLVGTGLHLTISTAVGLVFVVLLPTLPGSMGLWALVVGPLLWAGAQFALLPVVNSQVATACRTATRFRFPRFQLRSVKGTSTALLLVLASRRARNWTCRSSAPRLAGRRSIQVGWRPLLIGALV